MSNKIISSINAIIDNQTLPSNNPNNVVAIDTQYSRIGVGTATPAYAIDVSGTIRSHELIIKNNGKIRNIDQNVEIIFNNNKIYTQTIELSNIHVNNIFKNVDSTSINIFGDISTNGKIIVNNDLSVNNQLFVQNDVSFNSDLFVKNDLSVNQNINSTKLIVNDICVNNIYCNNSNNKIDICANLDLSGTLHIDGSLNVKYNAFFFQGVELTSDDRLKHNEVVINNGLNVVNKLVPQLYQKTKNFKVHDFSGIVNEPYIMEAGLIAQELELLDDISFCVNIGSNIKPYSVNYNNIFVYGLAAIKELDKKINNILDNSNNDSNNDSINNNINNNTNKISQLEKIISTQNIEITNLKKRIINLEKKI